MAYWKDRSCFVTGAAGLLGSSLVERLLQQDARVVVLLRDEVPDSRLIQDGLIDRINVVRGSLEDKDVLIRTINEFEVNTVFHLGAQTIVGTARRSAISTFESNIRGTWNLLEACHRLPECVQSIVVASSDKAYGSHDRLPYTEDTPLQGQFPYDVSKSCSDLISLSYFHTYRLPVTITRCGNLFGGGDLNFNRLIPGTIRSVIRGDAPIIRSDGSYLRDYFFVDDAVTAYMSLAEQMQAKELAGQAFNFGTETPTSVLELTQSLLDLMRQGEVEPVILNEASAEIPRQFLDCTKAREILDWSPEHTLEEGLRKTISWYESYLGAH